jgi:hypothetical protein
MKISISIFLGLGLIAGAIYYKPTQPPLSCSDGNCSTMKGKYIVSLSQGRLVKHNTETGTYITRPLKKVR